MRVSKDTVEVPDVRGRRSFFRLEIVRQDQPLEMKLESTRDFLHSEMRAARGPFSGMRSGCIVSLAFLSPFLRGRVSWPNSDSRNGLCFATSWYAREIIAPDVPHFRSAFLHIRPDSSSEGEQCMKDTVHPNVHFSVHLGVFGRARNRRSYAVRERSLWTRAKHGTGLERPHFWEPSAAQRIAGSLQPRERNARSF
jgi:hypothetical protein